LKDAQDRKVVWDDREVKVQIQGAGRLAGIDSGNLADVTPLSTECRRTCGGNLVAYVQRTGQGSIQVSMELMSEVAEEECRNMGSRYEIQISPIS
ncbi:MAG: hypothetical protein K2P13_10250, partial [Lachnospiraceae bacterium]|nr:hypothetical protein [Lachnospiraceae bacterium]